MIDWEAGTFDFDREFFYDLLEVARRYGDTPANNEPREFLCLLLGEEAQKEQRLSGYPVKRDMFDAWVKKQLDRSIGVYLNRENRITGEYDHQLWIYDLSGEHGDFIRNEKLPYFKKMLEEARHLPVRPAPILNIICEEAEDYFNGNKSAEEVADIVENRVELYLNERR